MSAPTKSVAAIELRNVAFGLGNGVELIEDLSFTVHGGETLVLLGRSGSGKTTTLKLINRLFEITSGELLVEGRSVREWNLNRLRRSIGYAIQEVGLFPHFTIERNIGLVPQIEKWEPERIRQRVEELMHLVGLDRKILTRYPRELSGGQRQRVGVARALAADPPILLMDEPFGALDAITRAQLQRDFHSLQQRLQKTVVFVTHDLHEALVLGTRISLMDDGRLIATSSPEQFSQSRDPRVLEYLNAFGLGDAAPNK